MKLCLGRRTWVALALLLAASPSFALADTPADSASLDRARLLVDQLGASEFARRERATEQLIELGTAALASLEEGVKSEDREVRYRAKRILDIVREMDFQRRLTAFASDTNPDHDYHLPGWSAYRDMVGGDGEARALFVEMQRAEPQLMQAIEAGPQLVASLLSERAQEPGRVFQFETPVGSVAAHLFAAAIDDVRLSPPAEQLVHTYCSQFSLQQPTQSDPQTQLLRKMLGTWIRRADGDNVQQILYLAMQYNVKEGLIPAEKLLREAADPEGKIQQPVQVRQFAILAVAKLGSEEQIPVLQPLLEDTTECVRQGKMETKVCDVALAASIHLAGEDHVKFGFSSNLLKNPQYVFATQSVGFEDEAARQAAIQIWREYWAKRSAEQAPPAQP